MQPSDRGTGQPDRKGLHAFGVDEIAWVTLRECRGHGVLGVEPCPPSLPRAAPFICRNGRSPAGELSINFRTAKELAQQLFWEI
jgi:hypothetical protein